jgi:tRNA(Ile2) C34 agmatinyltransferase TiaS
METTSKGAHICTDFRRSRVGKQAVFRCDECSHEYSSKEIAALMRSITIRAAEVPDER